jgi:hypothetical protein
MKYYLKRGKWCVRDGSGLRKFASEEEASIYVKSKDPSWNQKIEETYDGDETEEAYDEEETDSYK